MSIEQYVKNIDSLLMRCYDLVPGIEKRAHRSSYGSQMYGYMNEIRQNLEFLGISSGVDERPIVQRRTHPDVKRRIDILKQKLTGQEKRGDALAADLAKAVIRADRAEAALKEAQHAAQAAHKVVEAAELVDEQIWLGHHCNRCSLPDPPDAECRLVLALAEYHRANRQ